MLVKPTYRGRLAPSPTGLLHLGHARTFAIAAARAAGGVLVLRDEDLDTQRARPAYAAALLADLRWLGLAWQEGPDVGGPFVPYRQSARRELYLAAWRRLVEDGAVYPCRCSRRELRASAGAAHAFGTGVVGGVAGGDGAWVPGEVGSWTPGEVGSWTPGVAVVSPDEGEDDEPLYPGTCRLRPGVLKGAAPESPAGVNWRFRVADGEEVRFDDGECGLRSYIAGRDFGDFLVWRRDDVPAYQLAVVVDDAAMGITEVVRGADLLKSTARQLLLYRALELMPPAWFHCPLVVDGEGHRLAKRTDALAIRALREQGCTPAEVLALAEAATARPPLH